MYDYLIVHGSYGTQFENWFPWLFEQLEQREKKVLAPQFPTINQNLSDWDATLKTYDKYIGENTSIIAHSLGPAFALDYIIQHKKKVKNLYFAAPFYGSINIEEFDSVNKTFFVLSDLSDAKQFFNKAWCFYSDNDPYVPQKMSIDFSQALMAKETIVRGGKHLNASAGFTVFRELLKEIEKND